MPGTPRSTSPLSPSSPRSTSSSMPFLSEKPISTGPSPSMSLSRRAVRQIFILVVSFASLLLLFKAFHTYDPETAQKFIPEKYHPSSWHAEAQVSSSAVLETLSQLYEDERVSLLQQYDQMAAEALVRTPANGLNPDFNAYVGRLEQFIDKYFKHSSHHARLMDSLNRMVNARPPVEESEFRKSIFSFDKNGAAGVPDEFEWWNRRLTPKGWEIEVGDDTKMEEWFEECAAAMPDEARLSEEEASESGKAAWDDMWHGLGRPVLKSDLLRYLMMLIKGGLYTDSDTSVLSDPDLWGTHAHDLTPRGLVSLQRAMRHLDPEHPSYTHEVPAYNDEMDEAQINTSEDLDFASNPVKDATRGLNNPRVSLVVAVEYDTHHARQDPRYGYTRDLQIVQWTFLAKPFHPVFLDVLETATTEIMHRRSLGEGHNDWQSVLDVTGPGPFTDAVLRYVLVQHGVTPDQIIGMEDGALIGDVLILPLHAFGSYLGGENDWNAHDPSTRCTAHGFRGRWKGDMGFSRRNVAPSHRAPLR